MRIEIPPVVTIFDSIADWRKERGKRYSLRSLFHFIILAILCGKNGTRAMARWGKKMPERSKKRLGIAAGRHPSAAMLCRVFWQIAPEVIEAEIREWAKQVHRQLIAAGLARGLAIDGKSIRRAASLGSPNAFLVSAVCHQLRFVLAQMAVDDKTNEITCVPALLEHLLFAGLVITVDALLTQRDIAIQIGQAGGHYLMYVKGNQPKLLWALEQLFEQPRKPGLPPFKQAKSVDKGHGRVETREIWLSDALNGYLDWPGVAQVFRLKRTRWEIKANKYSQTIVYGVTSLAATQATPTQLIQITRDHWAAIENGIHWVRDVIMAEDSSSTRKPGAPQVRAAFRNIALSLARLAGFTSVTEAFDTFSADPALALDLLGL
jgi:predicted transposase YbfD/YdcC